MKLMEKNTVLWIAKEPIRVQELGIESYGIRVRLTGELNAYKVANSYRGPAVARVKVEPCQDVDGDFLVIVDKA
jgi:hypothetical protein